MENIGKRLAQARGFNRMTQGELAAVLGVTVQTISNWEHARRMPDADYMRGICLALNISSDWLLGLSEQMHR